MALLDPYQVGVDGLWSELEAAHLLRRAGFGGTAAERAAAVGNGSQSALTAAVDALVDFQANDPYLDQPATGGGSFIGAPLADLPNDGSDLGRVKNPQDEAAGAGHWLYRMRYSSQPLQEQLTLFLHDHMVSEGEKLFNLIPEIINYGNDGSNPSMQPCTTGTLAPDPLRVVKTVVKLMRDQNDLFRHTGADDFRELLINITRDPAMLLYLDNVFNVAGRPQENFARELMELFSMGVNNYSENDVKQIARCLTGESFPMFSCENDYSTEPGFIAFFHQAGNKQVFGQTVLQDFTGQETIDVIDLILQRVAVNPNVAGLAPPFNTLPATAVYMSWKLLRWFVSHDVQLLPSPDPIVLELADYLRGTDNGTYPQRRFPYDIRAALRRIFLSKFFYDEANRYTMYKTPADYVVSILKGLDLPEVFTAPLGPAIYMQLMGMRLFNPPNVAGWNHGQSWVNSGALVLRNAYAFRVVYQIILGTPPNVQPLLNLLAENGGPLVDMNDHEGMLNILSDGLLHEPFTLEEHDTLIEFVEGVIGSNAVETYILKLLGLTQLAFNMPRFQLK